MECYLLLNTGLTRLLLQVFWMLSRSSVLLWICLRTCFMVFYLYLFQGNYSRFMTVEIKELCLFVSNCVDLKTVKKWSLLYKKAQSHTMCTKLLLDLCLVFNVPQIISSTWIFPCLLVVYLLANHLSLSSTLVKFHLPSYFLIFSFKLW